MLSKTLDMVFKTTYNTVINLKEENMSFKIIADSAANIPATEAKKYKIDILSFVNIVNGREITCYDESLSYEEERIKGKEYYDAVRNGAEVKTSLINSAHFAKVFEEAVKNGEDILYVSLSKNISGTFQAATIAKEMILEDYPKAKIEIIDSLNASLGQGLHCIYASILRDKGQDIDTVAGILRNNVKKMNGVFTVADLKYLAKTGRITGAKALMGNMLSIKPILRGNANGYIVEFKKTRGRRKSLDELAKLLIDNIENPEEQIIGIAHADAYEEALAVADKIKNAVHPKEIMITTYDYCTGSHVGPDTIALFFMAKDRELGGDAEA